MPARCMPFCSHSGILHSPHATYRLLGHRLLPPISLTVDHALDVLSAPTFPVISTEREHGGVLTAPRAQGIPFTSASSANTHVQHIKYSSSIPMRLATPGGGWFPVCAVHYTRRCAAGQFEEVVQEVDGGVAGYYLRYACGPLEQPHGRPIGLFVLISAAVCHLTFHLVKLRSPASKCSWNVLSVPI